MLLPPPAVESQTSQAIESREAKTMPFHLEVKVHIEKKTQEIEDEKLQPQKKTPAQEEKTPQEEQF